MCAFKLKLLYGCPLRRDSHRPPGHRERGKESYLDSAVSIVYYLAAGESEHAQVPIPSMALRQRHSLDTYMARHHNMCRYNSRLEAVGAEVSVVLACRVSAMRFPLLPFIPPSLASFLGPSSSSPHYINAPSSAKVKFYCDINEDSFLFMEDNDKVYGFTTAAYEFPRAG
ncbi:hypothetical protein C8R45DRAFT_928460 [Mycena sanguinolenta]|nr:hypothetical protein C8R45DRAFT_928460 [Mycena sanguinolenta]